MNKITGIARLSFIECFSREELEEQIYYCTDEMWDHEGIWVDLNIISINEHNNYNDYLTDYPDVDFQFFIESRGKINSNQAIKEVLSVYFSYTWERFQVINIKLLEQPQFSKDFDPLEPTTYEIGINHFSDTSFDDIKHLLPKPLVKKEEIVVIIPPKPQIIEKNTDKRSIFILKRIEE